MIPEYCSFIRFQDKRMVAFIYLLTFILLGLYWHNAGFIAGERDVAVLSGMMAILLYKVVYELKAYWAYKCVVGTIDLSYFAGKKLLRFEAILTHPLLISLVLYLLFYAVIKSYFLCLTPAMAQIAIFITLPLIIYVVFRLLRTSYIKQVGTAAVKHVRYKHLYRYVFASVILSLALTLLTIAPLKEDEDFTFQQGVFSARLMVAMWILCTVVLLFNLFFMQLPRRYIFLGRLFLNEIDFYFSPSPPVAGFYTRPQWYKLLVVLFIEAVWIVAISFLMMLSQLTVCFEVWFLCCFLPCLIYYSFYLYGRWHDDFMMACDMYLRWGEIKKQSTIW